MDVLDIASLTNLDNIQGTNISELTTLIQKTKNTDDILPTLTAEAYKEPEFWTTVKVYTIKTWSQGEVLKAYRELIAGIITRQANSSMYKLALTLGCQIRDIRDPNKSALTNDGIKLDDGGVASMMGCPTTTWYEELERQIGETKTLSDAEKKLFDTASNMTTKEALIWGPCFAICFIRLDKRSINSVVNKMLNLNKNLSKLYKLEDTKLPDITTASQEQLKELLEPFRGYSIDDYLRNTLYRGMIETVIQNVTDQNTRGLFDYLILQSLAYTGMPLVITIGQVVLIYKLKAEQLSVLTTFGPSYRSWITYLTFKNKHLVLDAPEKFKSEKWKFSREFNPSVFIDMSYNQNYWLVLFLSIMVDYRLDPMTNFVKPGPTYTGLTTLRSKSPKLSSYEFEVALIVAESITGNQMTQNISTAGMKMLAVAKERRARGKKRVEQEEVPDSLADILQS